MGRDLRAHHSGTFSSVAPCECGREDEVGVNFHLEDNIHSGWSLLGRATTVVGADVKKDGSGAPTTGPQGKT